MSARQADRIGRIAAAFGVLLAAGPATASYFGRDGGAPPPGEPGSGPILPDFLRTAAAELFRLQQVFNAELVANLQAIRADWAPGPVLALIGVAFLYGVFHAAGPGHGKAVVASYFLARRAPLARGVALGAGIALVQGLSAIVIVSVLALLLDFGRTRILRDMALLELASYGLIVAIGLVMSWRALTGRSCCAHESSASPPAPDGHDHDEGHAHHGHAHHGHAHCHHPASGDRAAPALAAPPSVPAGGLAWLHPGGLASVALAVGLRPCTGALIVLLFALANGIFAVGIAATLVMALGVAITVSAFGIGAIGLRRGLTRTGVHRPRLARLSHAGLQIAGSLLITGLGALLFADALQHGGLPG